jgi:hypothetical protein
MTKEQFIHQAVIAMCANPKCYTYNGLDSYSVMVREAENLARALENEDHDFDFDNSNSGESMETLVEQISDSLQSIVDAIEKPTGKDLSTFQEIVYQLNEIRSQIAGGLAVNVRQEQS